jgi:hypothetical protein
MEGEAMDGKLETSKIACIKMHLTIYIYILNCLSSILNMYHVSYLDKGKSLDGSYLLPSYKKKTGIRGKSDAYM